VQNCFVDFSAQTKRKFARFDFSRIAQLHFDGNGADDRHPVVVVYDALHVLDQELPLVVKCRAVLEACPRSVIIFAGKLPSRSGVPVEDVNCGHLIRALISQ
jgi:hypothetical protein